MELVAGCGRDLGRTQAFAAQHGGSAFIDLDRMLDEARPDLVIVAIPPYRHEGQVERIAARGVHLLVEKPIALDQATADRMVQAVEKASVVAAVGFMYRFGDAVRRWREADTGPVGVFAGAYHCNALHAPWWRERAKSGGQMIERCDRSPASLGLRFAQVEGVRAYLRNGYQSWDGSYFVAPGTQPGEGPTARSPTLGFAMTALLGEPSEGGAVIVGFTRHDRFQSRFRFGGSADTMTLDAETLLDGVAQNGIVLAEPLVLFEHGDVEGAMRRWSALVAAESPLPPRLPQRRITGWCSWYNLYAAIDEANILEHLEAARRFRDSWQVPLEVFQIDDGFTPEMGDWLDVKPQFPRGIAPLLADIDAAGLCPGCGSHPFWWGIAADYLRSIRTGWCSASTATFRSSMPASMASSTGRLIDSM